MCIHGGMEWLSHLPDVIKSAAESGPLGIVALIICALCLLAAYLFRHASEPIRAGIFVLLLASLGTAAWAGYLEWRDTRRAERTKPAVADGPAVKEQAPATNPTPDPPPLAPPTEKTPDPRPPPATAPTKRVRPSAVKQAPEEPAPEPVAAKPPPLEPPRTTPPAVESVVAPEPLGKPTSFTVEFERGEYELDVKAKGTVQEAANYANSRTARRVLVVGHDDTSGRSKTPAEQRRAQVSTELVKLGVPAGTIEFGTTYVGGGPFTDVCYVDGAQPKRGVTIHVCK